MRNGFGGAGLVLLFSSLVISCAPAAPPAATPTAVIQPTAVITNTRTPVPSPTQPPSPLTLDTLRNAEYSNPQNPQERIRLSNGVYVAQPPPGQATGGLTVTLLQNTVGFGDLNGDGREDAALVLNSDTGGTGRFRTLEAVVNQNGVPFHAASVSLGDRVRINAVTIQAGVIVVDMVTHGPQDPLCCPTVPKVVRYRLVRSQLVEA